ncbi:MAG: hypothetical protein V1856_00940 [Candidatus Liptonbacteria bacterium]
MSKLRVLQHCVAGAVGVILILTVLEFPAPIGFEVRPQDNVSVWWLALFLSILVSEISAIALIYKCPNLGARLGILAAILNILQIIADQMHFMQPEIAPFGYLLLEDAVGVASLFLGYCSWRILKQHE